jgi:hypothetical protein
VEAAQQELRKARAAQDDERALRHSVQEARDRLQADADALRRDRPELEELRLTHAALQEKQELIEVEFGALSQRESSMEAARNRLQNDLEQARTGAPSEAQLAGAQSRLQQAQEQEEAAQARACEARKRAEVARQEVETLQRELSGERSKRELLGDQMSLLRADLERATRNSQAKQESVEAEVAAQADLNANIARDQTETVASRAAVQEAQTQQASASELADAMYKGANIIGEVFHSLASKLTRGQSDFHDGRGACKQPAVLAPAPAPDAGTVAGAEKAKALHLEQQRQAEEAARSERQRQEQEASQEAHASQEVQAEDAAQPLPAARPTADTGGSDAGRGQPQQQAPPQPIPKLQPQPHMLSLMVGSPGDSPPPAVETRAEGAEELPEAPELDDLTGMKRTATQSVLVMSGLQPSFKRPRLSKA